MNKVKNGVSPKPQSRNRSWADLLPRLASAGVLLAVTIVAVWLGGVWFALLLSAAFFGVYREWDTMVTVSELKVRGYLLAGVLALVPIVATLGGLLAGASLSVVGIGIVVTGSRDVILWRASGLLFFSMVIVALVAIRGSSLLGFAVCFFLGASVWMTDTGAYFAGRLFGGEKLSPAISPGKTRSGAIGGLLVGTLSGLLVWVIVTPAPWWIGLGLAALVSVAGQLGDLSESAVKRRFRIKDTSDLIPGHGGIMDRMDSLTFGALVLFGVGALHLGFDRVAEGILLW
ncbi:MAG TPA: phosphatidate cytidylyltransferase [Devosia sp.]|nr:phosphatidate cytidylyltransferase [Devosia sp.]